MTIICGTGSSICCVTLYSRTIRGVRKSGNVSTNVRYVYRSHVGGGLSSRRLRREVAVTVDLCCADVVSDDIV